MANFYLISVLQRTYEKCGWKSKIFTRSAVSNTEGYTYFYSDNDFVLVLKNTYKLDAENGHVSHTKLLLYMDKKHARE